jgi:hypothetical protein
MQAINENNEPSATLDHIVVVGSITQRTPTQVTVSYPSMMGDTDLTVTRTEFGAGGSIGVRLNDTMSNEDTNRAFAIKRCVCPTCDNNNEGSEAVISGNTDINTLVSELEAINARRVVVEVNENRTTIKCGTCKGTGKASTLPQSISPLIDGEWQDLTESMNGGELPASHMPVFPSSFNGRRGGIVDNITDMTMVFKEAQLENTKGDMVGTGIYTVLNEGYANEDNNYLGMQLGRPKTDCYAFAQHSTIIDEFGDWSSKAGLPYTTYGTNYGQDAVMDIRVIDGSMTKQEVMDDLQTRLEAGEFGDNTGYGLMSTLEANPDLGNIGFGVQIRHSFDGALTIRGVSERLWCLNGCSSTKETVILSATHKKGVFENLNFGNIAKLVMTAVASMVAQNSEVENMNDIILGSQNLEALIALQVNRGLISYPSIGQDSELTGGRQYRAFTQGWGNPEEAWVAVGEDFGGSQVGSLYQAYQNTNGIINHQPAVNDAHGRVDGGKAVSFAKTNADLAKQHSLFVEIQNDAQRAFAETMGHSPQGNELNEFIAEHGIPMLNEMVATETRSETVGTDSHGNITIREWNAGDILPTVVKNVGQANEVSRTLDAIYTPMAVVA